MAAWSNNKNGENIAADVTTFASAHPAVLYADFAGNLDSCIAIRTLLMQGKRAYLKAGAGIVADSDPERELQKSTNKSPGGSKSGGVGKKGTLKLSTRSLVARFPNNSPYDIQLVSRVA